MFFSLYTLVLTVEVHIGLLNVILLFSRNESGSGGELGQAARLNNDT